MVLQNNKYYLNSTRNENIPLVFKVAPIRICSVISISLSKYKKQMAKENKSIVGKGNQAQTQKRPVMVRCPYKIMRCDILEFEEL